MYDTDSDGQTNEAYLRGMTEERGPTDRRGFLLNLKPTTVNSPRRQQTTTILIADYSSSGEDDSDHHQTRRTSLPTCDSHLRAQGTFKPCQPSTSRHQTSHYSPESSSAEDEPQPPFSHSTTESSSTEDSRRPLTTTPKPNKVRSKSTKKKCRDNRQRHDSTSDSSPQVCKPAAKRIKKDYFSSPSSSSTETSDSMSQPENQLPATPTGFRQKYALPKERWPGKMATLIKRTRQFFIRKVNLERASPAISATTFDKTEERLSCYLGFLYSVQKMPLESMDKPIFEKASLIESYLDYLSDTRNLSSGTVSNHIGALMYPIKYMHRKFAPHYKGVPLIQQLRSMATAFQVQNEVERPRTRKELQAADKWLQWDEILQSMAVQRQKFELSRGRSQAREMMDLLLLGMYCLTPPSRGLEIRTLRYFVETAESSFVLKDYSKANVAVKDMSGDFTFHFNSYKTCKTMGHDQVTVEQGSELNRLLTDYLKTYRVRLTASDGSEDFVFLNVLGLPYSSSSFTSHLKALFLKLTGVSVSVNCLRSSFVTYAYSQKGCTESLKDSLASALRHSRRQAQLTYDRRTGDERKSEAVAFAREQGENFLRQEPAEQDVASPRPEQPLTAESPKPYEPGTFVAVVEKESTVSKPLVLLGRIQHYDQSGQGDVLLVWYKKTPQPNTYALELDGQIWRESVDSLHGPIKMRPSKTKGPDTYSMMTSLRTIHKAVMGDSRK